MMFGTPFIPAELDFLLRHAVGVPASRMRESNETLDVRFGSKADIDRRRGRACSLRRQHLAKFAT
jgi:hypothetical protein